MKTELVSRIDTNINDRYIKGLFEDLNIKKYFEKEVYKMEFDVEKIKGFYAEVLAKKAEAIEIALANKEQVIAERFEQAREEIARQVERELVETAEAPYKHDIELCEKFLVEEVVEENNEFEGEC